MFKCKYCGAIVNEVKPVENNYYFECKHCGKKSIFYFDLFDNVTMEEKNNNEDKADSDFEYWWRGYYKK